MAEKIKLLELDIDVTQLVKNSADAKTAVTKLREELKLLQAEPVKNREEIERLNAQLRTANQTYRESQTVLSKYTQVSDVNNLSIKEARNQLAAVSVLWANEAKLNGEGTAAAMKLAEAKLLLSNRLREEEKATGDARRGVAFYSEGVVDAIKKTNLFGGPFGEIITRLEEFKVGLIASKEALVATTAAEEGAAGGMEILKVAFISSGIGAVVVLVGLLISGLIKFTPVVNEVKAALAGFGAAVNVLEKSMVSAFTSPKQSVIDFGQTIKDSVIAQLASLKQIVVDISHLNFDSLKDKALSVADTLIKIGVAITTGNFGLFNDDMDGLGKSMSAAAVAAYELAKAEQQLEIAEKSLDLGNADRNARAKELELKARGLERKGDLEGAKKFYDDAEKLRQQNLDQTEVVNKEAARIAKEKAMEQTQLSEDDIDLIVHINDLKGKELERAKLLSSALSKDQIDAVAKVTTALQKEADVKEAQITKEERTANRLIGIAEKETAAKDKALKDQEDRISKHNDFVIKTLEDNLKLQEALDARNKIKITNDDTFSQEENRLANAFIEDKRLLNLKYEFEKSAYKGNADALLELEARHKTDLVLLNNKYNDITTANLKTLSEATIKTAMDELAVWRELNIGKLNTDKLITDEIYNNRVEKLQESESKERGILEQKFTDELITRDEFNKASLELDRTINDQFTQLDADASAQKMDRQATDAQNRYDIKVLQGESERDLLLQQLARDEQVEITSAEKVGASTTLIHQKYALKRNKIEEDVARTNLSYASNFLGALQGIFGKQTALAKVFGIAQATINTYLGATAALKDETIPSTFARVAAMASIIATGLAQVLQISGVKFQRGGKAGTTGGNLHANGGTKYYGEDGNVVELERGEDWYVLNRGASRAINSLSDINVEHGGVSFGTPSRSMVLADGGLVSANINDGGLLERSLSGGDLANTVIGAVGAAFQNINILTDVKDVINETGKYNKLVDGANL